MIDWLTTTESEFLAVSESAFLVLPEIVVLVPTTVTVTPATITDATASMLTATVLDQFGTAISNPSVTWSLVSQAAAVDASGHFTPAATYIRAASGSVYGQSLITSAVLEAVEAGGGSGDGDTLVNHNTGGTDALAYKIGGVGVDNATLRAYLASDYAVGNFTVQAETTTDSAGRWVRPMYLDNGGAYTLVAFKSGLFGPDVKQITVAA